MNSAIHKLKLFFCVFSGEDAFIIRKCKGRIQLYFALIGLLVLLVFVLCWISAALFMSHIFDKNRWVSIPIAILWALLVTNLYLLLLYTISPALLPVAPKRTTIRNGERKKIIIQEIKKDRVVVSFSLLFRVGLITFLAIISAQPINVWLFSKNFEEGDRFAEAIKSCLDKHPLSWILTVLFCIIMLLPIYFKFGVRRVSQRSFENDFGSTGAENGLRHLREQLGNMTDFDNLSKRILSINIEKIRTADFYFQKSLIEHRIILEEYEQFKKEYSTLLVESCKRYNRSCWKRLMPQLNRLAKVNPEKHQSISAELKVNLQVPVFERYEYWADHPFRTKYKRERNNRLAESELLRIFYQENIG